MLKAQDSLRDTADASSIGLGPRPADSVIIENSGGSGRVVIVCDHASNHVPAQFGTLGLPAEDLERHIAWDPGALGVARAMARQLDAALVAGGVSRLVIDCNRDPDVFDAIPESSEDTPVPGNRNIARTDRRWRIDSIYRPFHAAIEAVVAAKARHGALAVIGVHSFTPVYRGAARPWHVGVLFDRDTRLSRPLIAVLSGEQGLVVGANEPYSPQDRVYHTLDRHAQSHGHPSVMIEIRNDLVATPEAEAQWGARLATAITGALDGALGTEPEAPAA